MAPSGDAERIQMQIRAIHGSPCADRADVGLRASACGRLRQLQRAHCLNSDQNYAIVGFSKGEATWRQRHHGNLNKFIGCIIEFRDAVNRGGVSRQTALDALEYALEELLSDVCESEEHVKQYFEIMHERATRAWRRQNAVAG